MGVEVVKRITVLLAAWNGARFLPEQLRSLQAQTDPCFRVLMQDDGSTDGTQALLREAAERDPRFVLGREEGKRLGPAGNFRSLMAQAEDDLVALCDQDDRWRPDRLEQGRTALEAAETLWGTEAPLLLHSDCRLVDEAGAVLRESFLAHQGWRGEACSLAELLVQNNVTGCTVLMNGVLCRLGAERLDPVRSPLHDWFLAQTAAALGHIVFLPEPLVDYRQHGGNAVGASRGGPAKRALSLLRAPGKAAERIARTYRQTEAFLDAYGDLLPPDAAKLAADYLATEYLPRLRRVAAVRRLGCRMQSPWARAGQLLFG